ncbi:MAG: hypothetical protein AB7P69_10520 [Candidatus Binatia bacterium]
MYTKQLLAIILLILWWLTAARGDPNSPSVMQTEPKSLNVKYEGTLICFRCDITPSQENRARCEQEGHLPLLRRGDGYSHSLVGSTNSLSAQLASEALHGKKVHLTGIYYPKTNQILVEKVAPTER